MERRSFACEARFLAMKSHTSVQNIDETLLKRQTSPTKGIIETRLRTRLLLSSRSRIREA